MRPEHAAMDEIASDVAFRWASVAVIIVAVAVLTLTVFAGYESLAATTEVVPQYLQNQPASN